MSLPLCAQEKEMVLGGKEGWPVLSKMDGVVSGSGRFGYECMELATNARVVEDSTDLLIDFEGRSFEDVSGNYEIVKNALITSEKSVMGKNAGLSRGSDGLRLSGSETSLFGRSGVTGSFLIEFWLNPSIAENGETIFSWRSSRTVARYPLYQMIQCTFFNNRIQWVFTNVFSGYTDNSGEVSLSSIRTIVPNQWAHHAISFDEETGMLEYRIDGKLEGMLFITSNGRERGGSVYFPELGVAADIEICPNYTGLIDDFRIQRDDKNSAAENLRYDSYKEDGGRFVTQPILISQGAELNRLDCIVTQPAQTDVMFYVRSGDNFFDWTDDYPEWKPVENHRALENVKGLYFQIACDLFPDGGGKTTPSVTEIRLVYTEVPDPLPPFTLTAVPGNGEVTLSWSYSVDETAGGYYVFYGERPGEYLCSDSYEGKSPIDVGNVNSIVLSGLKNGKIYYFAVASYSRIDKRIMGILSTEVFARPLRK